MTAVSITQARRNLTNLINEAAEGRPIAICQDGRPVAQITAIPARKRPRLPDLTEFRKSLGKRPGRSKATIHHLREQERY